MIADPALKNQLIETFSFLRNSDADFRRLFFQHASLVNLEKGQLIYQQGSECTSLALILEGSARTYKLGESGREITLYRILPGQSCILTASCILSQLPFPAFAVCEQNIRAVAVPTADVERWMTQSAEWRHYVFGLVSERLANIMTVVDEVVFQRVDRRIASHLLKYADENGNDTIKITHQELAADLGTSREVVSRLLKEFEVAGCISIRRGTITLLKHQQLLEKSREN